MSNRSSIRRKDPLTGLYYPHLVPRSAIRRLARQIAERFHPDKIILFGSYAYGTPRPDSDVDLLVVMPTNNQIEQAIRIDDALECDEIRPGFALDLLVRTPRTLERRIRWGDCFLNEIVCRGRVSPRPRTTSAPPESCFAASLCSLIRLRFTANKPLRSI
jgi:predicted nucleotidyltransferase